MATPSKKSADAIAISTAAQGDPLFLTNSDHPGMSLTTIPFDGGNFLAWSMQVKLALRAKMKLGLLDGTCTRSTDDDIDGARWDRCNSMIVCWLLNSMTSEISAGFIYTESAKGLWEEISERYRQSSGPLIYQLRQELSQVVQGNMSVTAYYSKLKRCWDELQSLCGMPTCNCGALGKCTCGVMDKVIAMENESRLMQFLLKLNPEFDSVKSQILSIEPLPNVSRAFCVVLQVEKQKQLSCLVVDPSAFMANRNEKGKPENSRVGFDRKDVGKGKGTEKKHCTHCDGDGHIKEQCFELIGYPDWFKGKRNKRGGRVVAQTGVDRSGGVSQGDTPLEVGSNSCDSPSSQVDQQMVQAMCQELMKAFKGKMVMNASSGPFD